MDELIKITDMTGMYDISARTLRYYEDIGLLASVRSDDYAYRLYDEAAVQRLEQILILRKLNISIKDIQRVFSAPGSDVVLEVLGKKVADIDEEVALLHELKEIVLDFIRQIKDADFSNDKNVKLLYEKARDMEARLVNVDYNGNPANVKRFQEVTGKLGEKPDIIRKKPTFSVTFGIAGRDEVRREALGLYEKAFNAEKTWEANAPKELPDTWEGNLHIGMEINGAGFLLHPGGPVGGCFGGPVSCNMHFGSEEDLRRAYDLLSQEGSDYSMLPWAPHAPVGATVKDKFGVFWWLHT